MLDAIIAPYRAEFSVGTRDDEEPLPEAIVTYAREYWRYGYRRIAAPPKLFAPYLLYKRWEIDFLGKLSPDERCRRCVKVD